MSYLYPVPADAPADGTQIIRQFGQEWLPIILDRIDDLQSGEWFESAPDDIKQQIRELLDLLETDVTIPPQVFPTVANHFHWLSIVMAGNAIARTLTTGQTYDYVSAQNPGAKDDGWKFQVCLEAGDYDVIILWSRGTNRGILHLQVDGGGDEQTLDMYGTSLADVVTTLTFTLTISGNLWVYGSVPAKNASSSGYYCYITGIFFRPT